MISADNGIKNMKYPIKPDFTDDELALIEAVLGFIGDNEPATAQTFKLLTGLDDYAPTRSSILEKLTCLDE